MNLPEAGAVPWVIAHRGSSEAHPENTRAAFDAAVAARADAIELDLQLSADGVAVVYHDRTLARFGGARKRVAQLTLAELRSLSAGAWFHPRFSAERILTLDEVLGRYVRDIALLLEIKTRESVALHRELVRSTVAAIRSHDAAENLFLLGFDEQVLDDAAALAPDVRRVQNVKPPRHLRGGLAKRLDSLTALSADVKTLTPEFGAEVRAAGCPLLVYTCNTDREVDRARNAGAVGVMSDRPAWLSGIVGTGADSCNATSDA